jgi:hypothetical protein
MYLAFHSLKATSKYFVVPAILLFLGEKQRCQQQMTVLCMLCCLRLDVGAVVLCFDCRGTELVTFK